ncbi:disulfide bond formation protein B [Acuticoccus mangrovi]|nr:disulfide bond formation protein B [Acuticoccus mangrovi]
MTMRPLAALGLLLMIVAIATAWGFELFGGYTPCPLCLQQRIPYYVAIPVAILGLLAVSSVPRLGRLLLFVAAVAIFVATALGVYHAGVEWAWWQGPNTCGGSTAVLDAGNLLKELEETHFISCQEAAGRFLGLSFAGWNAAGSFVAGLLLLLASFAPRAR